MNHAALNILQIIIFVLVLMTVVKICFIYLFYSPPPSFFLNLTFFLFVIWHTSLGPSFNQNVIKIGRANIEKFEFVDNDFINLFGLIIIPK